MNEEHRLITIQMLAHLKGGVLALDMLGHPSQRLPELSVQELEVALRGLVSEGLVASIFERLDGPLFTLSERGRKEMLAQGCTFDENAVERTRELFEAYFCKTVV